MTRSAVARAARSRLVRPLVALALALGAIPTPASIAAERIAAIVNKKVILASEVDEQMRQAAARYGVDPADSVNTARLRKHLPRD